MTIGVGVIKAPVYWSNTCGADGLEASLVKTGLLIVLAKSSNSPLLFAPGMINISGLGAAPY